MIRDENNKRDKAIVSDDEWEDESGTEGEGPFEWNHDRPLNFKKENGFSKLAPGQQTSDLTKKLRHGTGADLTQTPNITRSKPINIPGSKVWPSDPSPQKQIPRSKPINIPGSNRRPSTSPTPSPQAMSPTMFHSELPTPLRQNVSLEHLYTGNRYMKGLQEVGANRAEGGTFRTKGEAGGKTHRI